MDLSKLLDTFLPVLGEAGVQMLSKEFETLAANNSGWKKSVLGLLASYVEEHGPDGIKLGVDAIQKLMKGGEVPDFTGLDIATAGAITAAFHNLEDKQRSEVNDFLVKMSKTLGIILGAIIRGAL